MINKTQNSNRNFRLLTNPYVQGGLCFGIVLLFIAFGLLFRKVPIQGAESVGYQSAATGVMMFAVINALTTLMVNDPLKFWSKSFTTYLVLLAAALGVAYLATGIWITDTRSYFMIFIVVSFAYFVLMSILNLMRAIVNFAENEEWEAPRQRSKKKK